MPRRMVHQNPPDIEQHPVSDNQSLTGVQKTNMWKSNISKMGGRDIYLTRHYDINDADKSAHNKGLAGERRTPVYKDFTAEQVSCKICKRTVQYTL